MSHPDTDEERRNAQLERPIRDVRWGAFQARHNLREQMPNPNPHVKAEAAVAAADLRDQLSVYRDQGQLDPQWDERDPNPDIVEEWLGETVEWKQSAQRAGQRPQKNSRPKAHYVDPNDILEVCRVLEGIARDLGFVAPADGDKDPIVAEAI